MGIMGAFLGATPVGVRDNAGRVGNSIYPQPPRATVRTGQSVWPGWLPRIGALLRRWRTDNARPARLALVERIALGPRQALLLVEAEGARLLVATSSDGSASFYPLSATPQPKSDVRGTARSVGRVSW